MGYPTNASYGLGQLVSFCLADTQIVAPIRRKLVCLVKDHQVVGHHSGLAQMGKHPRPRERVHADDEAVAVVANEWIGCTGIRARDHTERQAEEGREFVLPVADEARGRHDEDALDQAAGLHLADVEPRHDGLTRTGVIGE